MLLTRARRLVALATAALVSTALLLGVGAAGAAGAAPNTVMRTVTVSGRHVHLHVHGEVRVDLRTAVDGGYEWITQSNTDKSAAGIAHKYRRPYPHAPMSVGYPYHTYYLIRGLKPGTAVIRFAQWRPWDHSDVVDHFRITVTVTRN